MSISKFQAFMQKGCGPVILFVCAAVFAFFGFSTCGRGDDRPLSEGGTQAITVARVGEAPITLEEVEQAVEQQAQMFGGVASLPPAQQVFVYTYALQNVVQQASMTFLAQKNNITLTDQDLKNALEQVIDAQLEQQKIQLIMSGKLKGDATEQQFSQAFEKETGQSLAAARKTIHERFDAELKNPEKRPMLVSSLAGQVVQDKLKSKVALTDEELKKTFDTYTVKRIFFANDRPGGTAEERAEKALAEIKGGLAFEKAIDRYSNDPPTPNKRLSEVTTTLPAQEVMFTEAYQPLRNLKAGEVSPVIDVPGGKAIFKIVEIKSAVPTDFDQNKGRYREQVASRIATQQLQNQLAEIPSLGIIKWQSPAYEALYRLGQVMTDTTADAEQKEELKDIYADAKAALDSADAWGREAALYAMFGANDALWNAPGSNHAELREARIEVLSGILDVSESPQARLDLAQLYAEAKQPEDALDQLKLAAENNTDFEAIGQDLYGRIETTLANFQKQGIKDEELVKQIKDAQSEWRAGKAEFEKQKAEEQREIEAMEKEAAEAAKKAEAEAKKEGAATSGGTKKQ